MKQVAGLFVLMACSVVAAKSRHDFLGIPNSTFIAHEASSLHASSSVSSMGELLTQLSGISGLSPMAGDTACQSPDDNACLLRLLVLARAAAKKRQLIPRPGWPLTDSNGLNPAASPGEGKWIQRFLTASVPELTPGHCLEFGELKYTKLHFAHQCSHQHHTIYTGHSAAPGGMTATFEVDIDQGPGPIPWNTFDTVIATQVFEHVKDPSASASTLFKVLKPGGVMLWTVPMSWVHHVYPGLYGDHWRFTAEGGRLLLQRAGFEILSSECHGDSSTLALYAMGMGEAEMVAQETYSGDCNYAVHVGIRARKPLHTATAAA